MNPVRIAPWLLALALPLTAMAGRPLQTEDAAVLARGECEIEGVHARLKEVEAPTAKATSLQFGCGIGLRSQLALQGLRAEAGDETAREAALVGKTAIVPLSETQTGFTIAYETRRVRLPGEGDRQANTIIRGVMTHPTGPSGEWLLHANLGFAHNNLESETRAIWSVAAERTKLGPVDVMAEVYAYDKGAAWVNAGVRYTVIPEHFFVDASYGVQTNSDRAKLVTFGFKLAF